MKNLLTAGLLLLISGCASTGHVTQIGDDKIVGERVIALEAPNAPWVIEIQRRLREKGFRVLRWGSVKRVIEQTSETRRESFNEATARYVLVVEGYAAYDFMNRCFGGGYQFDHVTADLVDTKTSETVLNVNGTGYSENCPPMSGTIFGDIANAVDNAWSR